MATIIRMTRYGRIWKIELDCGHIMERTQDEIKTQQLYVDKRIGCSRCADQFRTNLADLEKKTRTS